LLVNTSRGGLVATDNLLHALQNGVIAGAALDVVEEEPLPASAPIVKAPNIIVTSHIAWYSSKSIEDFSAGLPEKLFLYPTGNRLSPDFSE